MSQRTAAANNAVEAAWRREQALVREGKGTRDWTAAQQKDILSSGKVHDENGMAFEGHHMKSVERFPDYQGESGNIQFLSRSEHLSAHNGSFRNYTNGRYDPISGETFDFGEGCYIPCEVLELSEPIVVPPKNRPINESKSENKASNDSLAKKQGSIPRANDHPKHINTGKRLAKVVKETGKYLANNPELVIRTTLTVAPIVIRIIGVASGHGGGTAMRSSASSSALKAASKTSVAVDAAKIVDRASPVEHAVRGYSRLQNGKEVLVRAYVRGGKKV